MSATEQDGPHPLVVLKAQIDARVPELEAALPPHIPVARFARVLLTAIQNNPELLQCDRRSVFNAALRAAQDGLLPDGRFGAIVVRRDNKSDTGKSANWQPMIAGIRQKARNSGDISTWDAHVVCEGDFFQFQLGDHPQINHTYDLKTKRGGIIGAYSVAKLKDGSMSFEVMSIDEIHDIRDRSDAWKAFKAGYIRSTPWSTDEGEMARKTVARRHSKVLPMSSDLDDLLRRDDALYDMEGASDARVPQKRPSLAHAMDRLATATTPRIGHTESAEETSPSLTGDGTEAGAAGGVGVLGGPPSAPPKQPPEGSPAAGTGHSTVTSGRPAQASQGATQPRQSASAGDLIGGGSITAEAAYAAGRAAFGSGVQRRAVPPEMRTPEREEEAKAWQAGWDAGKNSDEH